MSLRSVVLVGLSIASTMGCGSKFGRVVTEITVSSTDPNVLIVKACTLTTRKMTAEQVKVTDCRRTRVRRSAIVPVPVDAKVPAREDRVVTGMFERPGGGATVTTCRIGSKADTWMLLDCANTDIATAPLDPGAAPPPPAP